MDILETITRRCSVRNYAITRIAPEVLEQVRAAGEKSLALTAASLRFHLIADGSSFDKALLGALGDYGRIFRAPHYLAVSAVESDRYLLDAGYRFEQLILDATARGLGTCWIGGLFREATLRTALGLDEKARVVAVTPIGQPAERSGVVHRVMRFAVGSADRKPLAALFSYESAGAPLPPTIVSDARCAKLFEAVRRAPSWANKQPWRFVVQKDALLVYKDTQQIREGKDYHLLDCGIAMAHLHLAAQALGLEGRWDLDLKEIPGAPDAEAVARYVFASPWLPL